MGFPAFLYSYNIPIDSLKTILTVFLSLLHTFSINFDISSGSLSYL